MTELRICLDCGGPVPVDDQKRWLTCRQCGRDWFPYEVEMPRTWTETEIRQIVRDELDKKEKGS